jgi:hypothetical protein
MHVHPRSALGAFTGLVSFHWLSLLERQVEFVGVVFGVPAPVAFDLQPDDYGNVIVHI